MYDGKNNVWTFIVLEFVTLFRKLVRKSIEIILSLQDVEVSFYFAFYTYNEGCLFFFSFKGIMFSGTLSLTQKNHHFDGLSLSDFYSGYF